MSWHILRCLCPRTLSTLATHPRFLRNFMVDVDLVPLLSFLLRFALITFHLHLEPVTLWKSHQPWEKGCYILRNYHKFQVFHANHFPVFAFVIFSFTCFTRFFHLQLNPLVVTCTHQPPLKRELFNAHLNE